ncbi:MAG: hypothetical protein ACI93V_001018, partial [Alteromonadaceae bacterium]
KTDNTLLKAIHENQAAILYQINNY